MMTGRIRMHTKLTTTNENHDPTTGDATDRHPSGRIAAPGRVRAEARMLALVGASYVIGGMGLCAVGCTIVRSISFEGGV